MVITLKHLRWLSLLLFLCAVSGCQERVTKANFDRIEEGMTRAQVEAILGKPDTSYQGVLSWTTNHSRTVISVVLDDQGHVVDRNAENLTK